jgi:transcriptional regulator with PAS, ATPase and Fis domain
MRALLNYNWPGNVRELETRSRVVLCSGGQIG